MNEGKGRQVSQIMTLAPQNFQTSNFTSFGLNLEIVRRNGNETI